MSDGRAQTVLLVAVEPGVDPEGPGSTALGAEAVRLAGALDAGLRLVTWPADPPAGVGAVADALAALVRAARPAAVLLLDTDLSRQLAPMVAHRCGGGAVVGCSDVIVDADAAREGGARLVFSKPVHGGWLERDITAAGDSAPVVTLDLAGIEAPVADAQHALPEPELLVLGQAAAEPDVVHLETVAPDARSVDLVHARRIVTAGAGAASGGLLAAVEKLAGLLEGSVGATRVVTDGGHLPKERLIGQTGKTVTPELYVALGVSGSPHHVAGVRSADRIISVDRDVRAPVFRFSDVGYVADLEEVLPALVRRIGEWRDEPADA